MTIAFACPSCGRSHEVDDSRAGRKGRCQGCGEVMTVPDAPESDEPYALADSEPSPTRSAPRVPPPSGAESTFVSRQDPARDRPARKKSRRKKLIRQAREEADDVVAILKGSWKWLVGVPAVAMAVLGLIAVLVPNGSLVVACLLAVAGMALLTVGFAVGAYGAFHEDFLNGMLYVFIPLYTAYFIVTNWDAMWRWFLMMAAGAILIAIAGEIALPRLQEMARARPPKVGRVEPVVGMRPSGFLVASLMTPEGPEDEPSDRGA